MLVDIQPDSYSFSFRILNDTRHVQCLHDLCGISVMRSTRHIPFPIEKHIGYVMIGAKIHCFYGSFRSHCHFTHDLSRLHPLRRIDNLTCRIQILYDIIMFQQISRTVSRHDDFPRCGTIGHHIHRTIHDRNQRISLLFRSHKFSQTPIIHIRINQSYPLSSRQFHGQSPFHRMFDAAYGQIFKLSLRPLLSPGHRE